MPFVYVQMDSGQCAGDEGAEETGLLCSNRVGRKAMSKQHTCKN